MQVIPLNKLFLVTYGNKFDLNKKKLSSREAGGVNFVGRSSQNHGVSAVIVPEPEVKPYPAGCITVSLGGSKLLSSFVQLQPFYTAQNVAVLQAQNEMSFAQKLYVCLCIRHNRFRYSAFGREANRTLRSLPVPTLADFPAWVSTMDQAAMEQELSKPLGSPAGQLTTAMWRRYRYAELFELRKGKRLTKADMISGDVPFIGAIDSNNGIRQWIRVAAQHTGNVVTVNYNGSVAEAFYQPTPFWASDDVNVLYPKFEGMDPLIGLFVCTVIRREKYRFNYGRKWNLERMRDSVIRLPALPDGSPDLAYMRAYMGSLRFSSQLDPAQPPAHEPVEVAA